MTEVITRNRIATNANTLLRDRCNSGIVVGSDNLPQYYDPSWFGGTTQGLDQSLSASDFTAGEPSASQAAAVLRDFANKFSHIRKVRIVIYRTKSGYATDNGDFLMSQATFVANTSFPVGNFATNVALADLRDGAVMNLEKVNSAIDQLWTAYNSAARGTALTLTSIVCHDNCHDNCHTARARR